MDFKLENNMPENISKKITIILASQSKSRQFVLNKLKIPYEIMPANIDETQKDNESVQDLVKRLSYEKALKIANILPKNKDKKYLIIGSDQVLCINNDKVLGKPLNHKNAISHLRASSGKLIDCYTGMCMLQVDADNISHKTTITNDKIKFKELSDDIIERYLLKEKPYQCAGAVQYEGLGIALLEKVISDDPNSIIGLPLMILSNWLMEAGFDLFR